MASSTFKRKSFSLEQKMEILKRLQNGEGSTSVARSFNMNESTVRTIKKNEATIRKSINTGTSLNAAKIKSYVGDPFKVMMEKALLIWIEDLAQRKIPVDRSMIKQRALTIYKKVIEQESNSSCTDKKMGFAASSGWLQGFLNRYDFNNLNIKGKSEFVDKEAVEEFSNSLASVIEQGDYTSDQVFNATKTVLFLKRLPKRSMVEKYNQIANEFKTSNERITFLLCCNASGDRMMKPLIVGKTERPRYLQNVHKAPFHYIVNKKTWVTENILKVWFNECLVPELQAYMAERNSKFKIILILEKTLDHIYLYHPNIKILYLPSNTASVLQPLDQGVITTFKSNYIRHTFQYIFDKLEEESLTLMDVWKTFSMSDCMNHAIQSLNEIRPMVLNSCWNNIWPDCVSGNISCISNTIANADIISLARSIDAYGFDDIDEEEINEMMVDKPMSDEEVIALATQAVDPEEVVGLAGQPFDPLAIKCDEKTDSKMTTRAIRDGLKMAMKLERHFLKHDPNKKRAKKFQEDLQAAMAEYKDLVGDLL